MQKLISRFSEKASFQLNKFILFWMLEKIELLFLIFYALFD